MSALSQPRLEASSVRGSRRPWEASWPEVELPLLYSIMSGTSSPVSTILAFFWSCSKVCASFLTVTSGCFSLKISMARAQAWPMAESSAS